jgi:nucleoside-triphosphatase THEP1
VAALEEPEGLLVTGVYGVGKTALVEEVADILERRGLRYAAVDVDWLSWFWAPDEAT